MPIKTDPASVQKGVRDFVVWETRTPVEVEVFPNLGDSVVRVSAPRAILATHPAIETDLRVFLPEGYTLEMHWT